MFRKINSTAGFSLTELMVVFVIVGILAVMGIPRMRTFIAQARQGEAKSNVSEISKLQHLYMSANDKYLEMGAVPASGKSGSGAIGYDNSGTPVVRNCDDSTARKLGFKSDGCENFRYGYWVKKKTVNGIDRFIVGAFASSNADARIFPTCDGSKQEGTTDGRSALTLKHADTTAQHTDIQIIAQAQGDTWMMDDTRKLQSDSIIQPCTGESKTGSNVGS